MLKITWKNAIAFISGIWVLYSVVKELFIGRTYLFNIIRKIITLCNLELTNIRLWYIAYPLFLFIIVLLIMKSAINRQKFLDLSLGFYFNAYWFINRKTKKVDKNPLCSCCYPPRRLVHSGGAFTTNATGEKKKHPVFTCKTTEKSYHLRNGDTFLNIDEAVELIYKDVFPNK